MTDQTTPSAYTQILGSGPLEPGIGGALISLVQVAPGFERSYNEWYDNDHFYSAMVDLPWCFSGARWVATRELRELRYPSPSEVTDDLDDGNFLNVYFGSPGRYDELAEGSGFAFDRLEAEGRMHRDGGREQVFTALQEYVGVAYRDEAGPRDFHALDYPYRWCAVEVIDAPDAASRAALENWLLTEHLPSVLPGSPAAMALAFRARPIAGYTPGAMRTDRFPRRVTVLWMLEADPAAIWTDVLADEGDRIAASGLGRLELVSGFRRLLPGTHTHLDDL